MRGTPPTVMASLTLAGSPNSSSTTDTGDTVLPSTSGWLPARKMLRLPSSALMLVVWTYLLRSRISWSRWSSRSLGVWPLPIAMAICSLVLAIWPARLLMAVASILSWLVVPMRSSLIASAVERKRCAISSARASATARAVRSVGALVMSE